MITMLALFVVMQTNLEDRVAAARSPVAFEFATHDNVCGDGYGIFISDDTSPGWNERRHREGTSIRHGGGDDDGPCDIAPARAMVEHEGARVTSIRVTVGGVTRSAESELGDVSAEAATRFLLAAAPRLNGRSADDAVTGAAIADVPKVWQRLLEIARDNGATESSRKASVFWVGHEAAAAAIAGLGAVAQDDDATTSVRKDALFFLAQRRDSTGIDALIRIVRQSKNRQIRKDAVWWLGQSQDARALAFFAELLEGR